MQFIHRILIIFLLVALITIQALLFDESTFQYFVGDNTVVAVSTNSSASNEAKKEDRFFVAVIDAGSTGTRLHLFEFARNESLRFDVKKEIFKEVKPGLSHFVLNPAGAGDSVQVLIDKARATVPLSYQRFTPIIVKATAGLRLLSDDQADAILKNVEKRVARSGFLMRENAVAMLSGVDEGVFSWYTLNVLLNRLKYIADEQKDLDPNLAKVKQPKVAAALDLGGGSTQLTFLPITSTKPFSSFVAEKYAYKINVFGKEVQLYTHSYLGNGLIAARHGIIQDHPISNSGFHTSSCFPDNYTLKSWEYAGHNWHIKGVESSFDRCYESAQQYINKTGVEKVAELGDHDVYAFSYFYDRGLQAGLVSQSEDNRGDYVTVIDFKNAAKKACSRSKSEIGLEHWKPWQCLDLTYIYTLLHYGYGLKDSKKFYLAKRFRNMELSWALGAGFDLLHSNPLKTATTTTSSLEDPLKESLLNASDDNNVESSLKTVGMMQFVTQQAFYVLSLFNLIS